MHDKPQKDVRKDKPETIQDIAIKLVEEQLSLHELETSPKERTIFMLGSKGVGKSTVLNKFFEREENSRSTLALEYSYGRRTGGSSQQQQKQILNMWELGSLENAQQLIEVPLRTHGVNYFAAVIMLDLSQPQHVWLDMKNAYYGLKKACKKTVNTQQEQRCLERQLEHIKKDNIDLSTLDVMPFSVVIVGGKYDLFMDFDPALKKHICRNLRAAAHLIGAALLFYSNNIPKLAKTLRDTISHLGFGSPSKPFRSHVTDYNDAVSVWFGKDSWECIDISFVAVPPTMESIGALLVAHVPQVEATKEVHHEKPPESHVTPANDPGFRENVIDEIRTQKQEELEIILRESQLRGQFESVLDY